MAHEDFGGEFRLVVPVDASGVEGLAPESRVKVAVVSGADVVSSQVVGLDTKGQGEASFRLGGAPAGGSVVVGPHDAGDDELVQLQTIVRRLPSRLPKAGELKIPPVAISAFYWSWWRRWCRTFTLSGRVVCPDGSPVPGATVCAYDVDWWWWWTSSQQVGCAVTDASGAFKISFRWCCGWWPWWWWRLRHWQLEPWLVERIRPVLERDPRLKVPTPSPRPSLAIFEELSAQGGFATRPASQAVDLGELPAMRERLLKQLPLVPELESLRIWPWWPWQPWWDCAPDIVFRVTQPCRGEEQVILDEGVWSARWNIPTSLSVTLTATGEACCINEPPPPSGDCMVISSVCGDLVSTIGGNPTAPAAPLGYLHPGVAATHGDRPYAGRVSISGLFGDAANVDFYEFEWATAAAGPWNPMPPAAAGGFTRYYWGQQLGGGPVGMYPVNFSFTPIGGRLVVESREHFEANNDPLSWGATRFWVSNRDLLIHWLTANTFADDTYHLRLIGYDMVGGVLGNPQILPLCGTKQDNGLVLTIDNSTSTLEPEADVVDVRINGVSAGPCSNIDATGGGSLEVDFVAYDEDSHLAFYSLIATYGKNLAVNLLTAPGATLTPVALGVIPAADYVGPDYGTSRNPPQNNPGPHWRAGGLRLTIPDLRNAFPETCCYQLELRVYKRGVVNCDHNYTPSKLSYYSLTVVV